MSESTCMYESILVCTCLLFYILQNMLSVNIVVCLFEGGLGAYFNVSKIPTAVTCPLIFAFSCNLCDYEKKVI